jgi:outer membrane protein
MAGHSGYDVVFPSSRLNRNQSELLRERSGTTVQANLFYAAFWFELKAAEASTAQAALELFAKEHEPILITAAAYFETLCATDEQA